MIRQYIRSADVRQVISPFIVALIALGEVAYGWAVGESKAPVVRA